MVSRPDSEPLQELSGETSAENDRHNDNDQCSREDCPSCLIRRFSYGQRKGHRST